MMTTPETFIAAAHAAHLRGWTRDEAARWMMIRVAEAQLKRSQPLGR